MCRSLLLVLVLLWPIYGNAALSDQLEHLIWLSQRTQFEVQRFDHELDQRLARYREGTPADSMMTSPEYMRLMSLWEKQREEREDIKNFVIEHGLLDNLAELLQSRKDKTDRLALIELSEEFPELSNLSFNSADELTRFLDEQEPGQTQSRREWLSHQAAEAFQKSRPEFESELQISADRNRETWQASKTKKLKIYPSITAAGTIDGSSFPKGTWALTFDDGPSGKYTPQVLSNLAANGFKASFFWLAENAAPNVASIQAAGQAGHMRGVHSFSHPDLTAAKIDLKHEIDEATHDLAKIYGEKPNYFRCPYGSCIFSKRPSKVLVRKRIRNLRMVHVLWNVDSIDWQDKDPKVVYERTIKEMTLAGHGIVLFHDIHPQSVEASAQVMSDYLKPQGHQVQVKTIQAIVSELNGGVGKF